MPSSTTFAERLRIVALLVLGGAAGASAAEPGALLEAILTDRPVGWTAVVDVGGTVSFTDAQNVVGRDEGTSATIGFSGKGRLDWNEGPHEWRNILRSTQKFTKSTDLDVLSKSADQFDIESLYIHHWWDWGGPYVRVALDMPLFTGRAIEDDEETFIVIGRDGEVLDSIVTDNLKLSDAFEPLELRTSVGGTAKVAFTERTAVLETLLGVGARYTYADGVLVEDDDEDTDEIELRPVDVFQQFGLSSILRLSGRFREDTLGYQLGADLFLPFAHTTPDDGKDFDDIELTSVDFTALLSLKPLDWLSIEYEFLARRDPQIIREWQLTSILSVKLGLSWSYDGPDTETIR